MTIVQFFGHEIGPSLFPLVILWGVGGGVGTLPGDGWGAKRAPIGPSFTIRHWLAASAGVGPRFTQFLLNSGRRLLWQGPGSHVTLLNFLPYGYSVFLPRLGLQVACLAFRFFWWWGVAIGPLRGDGWSARLRAPSAIRILHRLFRSLPGFFARGV